MKVDYSCDENAQLNKCDSSVLVNAGWLSIFRTAGRRQFTYYYDHRQRTLTLLELISGSGCGWSKLELLWFCAERHQVGEVWWAATVQNLLHQWCNDLKFDTILDRQPIQLSSSGTGVRPSIKVEQQPSSCALYSL